MKSNLAHNLDVEELHGHSAYAQDYTEQAPLVEPIVQELSVPTGISRLEIILLSAIGLILFVLLLLNVYSDLGLSTASRKVQDVSSQVQTMQFEIENLEQHVHELSRYDRVNEIAEKYGLELHEENIRNLSQIE